MAEAVKQLFGQTPVARTFSKQCLSQREGGNANMGLHTWQVLTVVACIQEIHQLWRLWAPWHFRMTGCPAGRTSNCTRSQDSTSEWHQALAGFTTHLLRSTAGLCQLFSGWRLLFGAFCLLSSARVHHPKSVCRQGSCRIASPSRLQ